MAKIRFIALFFIVSCAHGGQLTHAQSAKGVQEPTENLFEHLSRGNRDGNAAGSELAEQPPAELQLEGIELPDIPVRWTARTVEQLNYFSKNEKGRTWMAQALIALSHSKEEIQTILRHRQMPEDLVYVVMVESGFNPLATSPRGAVGFWQLMEGTAAHYGLEKTLWVDPRRSPLRSTEVATTYLTELHQRLGSWEMVLAAYNFGQTALLRTIQKYNSNNFWALTELEAALPYETAQYVPKIMACAIIGRNPERFGFAPVIAEVPTPTATVDVAGGVPLQAIAKTLELPLKELKALNPELRRSYTPLDAPSWSLRIPKTRLDRFSKNWPALQPKHTPAYTYRTRQGERVTQIATRLGIEAAKLRALNDLGTQEDVRTGDVILVPSAVSSSPATQEKLVVTVPDKKFAYAGRKRIFYKVLAQDSVADIAEAFSVTQKELADWNLIDPSATLQSGMMLQLFVSKERDLSGAVFYELEDVQMLVAGSEEFFEYHEGKKGRKRLRYRVQPGESLTSIGEHFGLSIGSLARINNFSPNTLLKADQEIIVYAMDLPAPTPLTEEPVAEKFVPLVKEVPTETDSNALPENSNASSAETQKDSTAAPSVEPESVAAPPASTPEPVDTPATPSTLEEPSPSP